MITDKKELRRVVKDSILHIRVTSELLNQLKQQAKKRNRTLSNFVETILKDYLNNE